MKRIRSVVLAVVAIASPAAADVMQAYPAAARRADAQGEVMLDCGLTARGALTHCKVLYQLPEDVGFGAAALRMAARSPDNPAARHPPTSEGIDVQVRFCLHPPSITPNLLQPYHVTTPAYISRQPGPADIARVYPAEAKRRGLSGVAIVLCPVAVDGSVGRCSVIYDSGNGFGAAAVALSTAFRGTPRTVDGVAVGDGTFQTGIEFGPNPPALPAPMPPSIDAKCRSAVG